MENDLEQSLDALENNLETPIVPGELASWMHTVRQSCDNVGPALRQAIQVDHVDQLRQISDQDPELLARVQQLEQEDREIQDDFDALRQEISVLSEQDLEALDNQPQTEQHLGRIIKKGLAFIIRTRMQEKALATWHAEAFQRDRGEGD